MNGNEIDMRMFAQRTGATVTFSAGSIVFNKGDLGSCMYIVQSGMIEMLIGDKVVEICGPNEAIGFMSMVDGAPDPRYEPGDVKIRAERIASRGGHLCHAPYAGGSGGAIQGAPRYYGVASVRVWRTCGRIAA